LFYFIDAFIYQISNLTAHNLGDLATLPPENISGALLTNLTVGT
jgi:hypothetical protein